MAIESKLHRCDHDDPKRCQAVTGVGQCPYIAVEGGTNCPMHGGTSQIHKQQLEDRRNYNLGKWQARVDHLAEGERVKTLREEIGITRMLLEEIVIQCKDETQLLINQPRIGDLVTKIEKLVVSCHKLESSSGMLLDKSAVLKLAGKILEIIERHVTNPDVRGAIADDIAKEFSE